MHDIQNTVTEFDPELDEFEFGNDSEFAGTLDEADEMELAAELLEVADEAGLDQFLGDLIRKAGRVAGQFIRSPTGRALGGILKGAAKKALPHLGRAAGSYFGGAAGGDVGARLADQAGRIFGLELEGLSPEDQEFEAARHFVRFASNAAQRVAQSPSDSPQVAARNATVAAARQHAPGLISNSTQTREPIHSRNQGRWQRRGRTIVVENI